MSQTEATSTALQTMRAGIDKAQSDAAAMHGVAEEISARAAAAGFGGIVAGMTQVRDRIRELQARLGTAAGSVNEASTTFAEVPKEASPAEVIAALNRVAARVNTAHEAVGMVVGSVDEVRTLVGRVLQGGDPGPLLSRLAAINEILTTAAQRGSAARQSLAEAVGEAQRMGSSGN